jgi:alanine dehydrogenase
MPGAVGRTSTFALCNVTLPWAVQIAGRGLEQAARELPPIAAAVNIHCGRLTNRAVAETFDMPYTALLESDQ